MLLRRNKKKLAELEAFDAQKEALQAEIAKLQSFLKEAPEKIQQEQINNLTTLPAPDELQQLQREKEFFGRLTGAELTNERRTQARSAVLFVLLVTAILFVALWINEILETAA